MRSWSCANLAIEELCCTARTGCISGWTGHFPSSWFWKHATITPIIKKAGLDPSIPSSYRPVSNLTFLSKVLERVVHKQMTRYLVPNNLLPKIPVSIQKVTFHRNHAHEGSRSWRFSPISQLALVALLDFWPYDYLGPFGVLWVQGLDTKIGLKKFHDITNVYPISEVILVIILELCEIMNVSLIFSDVPG